MKMMSPLLKLSSLREKGGGRQWDGEVLYLHTGTDVDCMMTYQYGVRLTLQGTERAKSLSVPGTAGQKGQLPLQL